MRILLAMVAGLVLGVIVFTDVVLTLFDRASKAWADWKKR